MSACVGGAEPYAPAASNFAMVSPDDVEPCPLDDKDDYQQRAPDHVACR